MLEYTPEQIEQARFHVGAFERTGIIPREARNPPYKDAHGQDWALENEALIILAALEAAEQERDEWRESARTANTALLKVCKKRDALVAYAAKLEKAGDFMRGACPIIIARDNWDAARKEKPEAKE